MLLGGRNGRRAVAQVREEIILVRRCLIALAAASFPLCGFAQRPPVVVPTNPDAVLEQLPKGYSGLTPGTEDSPASLAQIEQMLATAASTGDARLVARAEASLARFPAQDNTPSLLGARAYAAQYRHDFSTALTLLDRLIRISPRDAEARLARAQILLVQGKLDQARAECTALALGVDAGSGLLCVAAIAQRRGDADSAARLIDRWLARAGDDSDARRYAMVVRAEAASRGGADADQWFRRALALAPADVRTLAAYSRHLRAEGRPNAALALLADAPLTDHLQLERALAAHAAASPQAAALAQALARRYRMARAVGSEPDLRDEAEFLLALRGDAKQALILAQRNFVDQRDYEDVALLRRASIAANAPEALLPLRAWAESQQLELPPPRDDTP